MVKRPVALQRVGKAGLLEQRRQRVEFAGAGGGLDDVLVLCGGGRRADRQNGAGDRE